MVIGEGGGGGIRLMVDVSKNMKSTYTGSSVFLHVYSQGELARRCRHRIDPRFLLFLLCLSSFFFFQRQHSSKPTKLLVYQLAGSTAEREQPEFDPVIGNL